jgi:hypothetical protein
MNRHQRRILVNFAVVIVVTIVASAGMIEMKNWVNRSEAMRAMEQLEQVIVDYRQKNGSVPPDSYVEKIKESLEGQLRLGNIYYRARWIGFNSSPDTVLAYVTKEYHSLFFRPGAIVLMFDGRVQWVDKATFDKLLAGQQSKMEIDMTPK